MLRNAEETLTVYRLIDPGSEAAAASQWFAQRDGGFVAGFWAGVSTRLWRCRLTVLEHRPALFQHLRRAEISLLGEV